MKYIIKQEEPDSFSEWKALENEDWEPTYDDLSGREKREVKSALTREQGGICCYCERRLLENDSHIEHCKPQHRDDVDPLDFSNMICSCQNRIKKGEPRHCGNLKDDWFDEDLFITPLLPECEEAFSYSGDGHIVSAHGLESEIQTIKKLGLDLPKLCDLRAQVLSPFLEDDLEEEELKEFVVGYLRKNADGKFNEFWTMINGIFNEHAA